MRLISLRLNFITAALIGPLRRCRRDVPFQGDKTLFHCEDLDPVGIEPDPLLPYRVQSLLYG